MTSQHLPGPRRRSVLLLGVGTGVAVLSGCTLNNPYSSDKTPAVRAVPDLEPDVGLAVQAVTRLTSAQRGVEGALATYPVLATRLSGLTAAYRTYLDTLLAAVPDGVDASPGNLDHDVLPGSRAQAISSVHRDAVAAKQALTGFALRAESGAFARLLGSMAAGLSQQLVVLAR